MKIFITWKKKSSYLSAALWEHVNNFFSAIWLVKKMYFVAHKIEKLITILSKLHSNREELIINLNQITFYFNSFRAYHWNKKGD